MSASLPPLPRRKQFAAAAVLVSAGFMLTMGMPGMDFMGDDYDDAESRAEILEEHPVWGRVVITLHTINRDLRRPVMRVLQPLEQPLRITQDWNLFRDGPGRVRRLEIYVDETLRHRSADPEFTWLNAQLRNRHIRPLCEKAAREGDAVDWPGLVRFVAARARAEFPDAREVWVLASSSRFPGDNPKLRHGWRARSPAWIPERIPEPQD